MGILVFIVPIAIVIAIVFVCAFVWASKKGQFDDLDTPAHKMLLNDEKLNNQSEYKKRKSHE